MVGGRYFTADLHLGHKLVANLRGFDNIDRHDETILKMILSCQPSDEIFILGDISGGSKQGEELALDYLSTVPATLHLIAGNHDSVSSIHRKGFRRQRRFLEVFETVQDFMRVRIDGQDVLLSHYPYEYAGDGPDRPTSRYLQYRLPSYGLPLMHGHSHQNSPHMLTDNYNILGPELEPDYSQYNVGWDAHKRLVGQKDLDEWIRQWRNSEFTYGKVWG